VRKEGMKEGKGRRITVERKYRRVMEGLQETKLIRYRKKKE
jgi:hypothetical protein